MIKEKQMNIHFSEEEVLNMLMGAIKVEILFEP